MKREIPKKNYVIVFLMAIVVMGLVFYLAKLYTNANLNKKSSLMSEYLFNVTLEEMNNYLLENPNIIIYWANNEDLTNEKFEKQLKKYIVKNNLQKNFVFVNTNNISSKQIETISNKYLSDKIKNINLKTMPTLLIVEDGKIVEVIYTYEQEIKYLKEKLKSYGVIE